MYYDDECICMMLRRFDWYQLLVRIQQHSQAQCSSVRWTNKLSLSSSGPSIRIWQKATTRPRPISILHSIQSQSLVSTFGLGTAYLMQFNYWGSSTSIYYTSCFFTSMLSRPTQLKGLTLDSTFVEIMSIPAWEERTEG